MWKHVVYLWIVRIRSRQIASNSVECPRDNLVEMGRVCIADRLFTRPGGSCLTTSTAAASSWCKVAIGMAEIAMASSHTIARATGPNTADLVLPGFSYRFSRSLIRCFAFAKVDFVKTTKGLEYGNDSNVGTACLNGAVGVVVLAFAGERAGYGCHAPTTMIRAATLTRGVEKTKKTGLGGFLLGKDDLYAHRLS